jgi:hypothetical protein
MKSTNVRGALSGGVILILVILVAALFISFNSYTVIDAGTRGVEKTLVK